MVDMIVRVQMTPAANGSCAINLDGSAQKTLYLAEEAEAAAIVLALNYAARTVARNEVKARDGFKVEVKIVSVEKSAP